VSPKKAFYTLFFDIQGCITGSSGPSLKKLTAVKTARINKEENQFSETLVINMGINPGRAPLWETSRFQG
jgi:hypothetical protein